ncbi:hypothetical protein LOD99_8956 [Oopsacas minuta]|uniref:2-amino-3-ketobutyrate coenzyme A ligase, mitochondrial n=1 Tax=Oopsacas minuta TaxID=111878 RepID=A0AAV7JE17_9METZ|nr:hypothetical protein LOD99_8956 [Oopsacas minuta]
MLGHTAAKLITTPIISTQIRCLSVLSGIREQIQNELQLIKDAGTFKHERVITSPQAARVTIQGRDQPLLNFCANNYLGLSSNSEVISAAKSALATHGAGMSSVRFICGTQDIHKELEKKISTFHQKEDSILYSSCFDANAGFFEAFLNEDDVIISDTLNHASIIDGIRLSKAKRLRYKHMDMDDLEMQLKDNQKSRRRLVVSDGVFSMDGDITPLKDILFLASKYNALVFLDECHATGLFGKSGRGTEDYYDVIGKVHIINSTLGKALGGASGGYTSGPKEIIDLLRQKSRPYLFSNTLPPPMVAGASKVLDILMRSSQLTEKLASNTKQFRDKMTSLGFKILGANHPICPVYLGDARLATGMAEDMLNRGIYVIGFSYPVVPEGQARIRVQLSAVHSSEDVDTCVNAFAEIGKSKGVI